MWYTLKKSLFKKQKPNKETITVQNIKDITKASKIVRYVNNNLKNALRIET